ncbi:MAG TPA: hypothetical protein VFH69_05335 [Gemmatimonadota bacterium]|nr:hypothetical protein [Gemmatimonadota bacterium]
MMISGFPLGSRLGVGSRVPVLLALAAIACGGEPGEEAAFPSRDWSGPYALEVVESSTDCLEADAPPLGDVILDVRQSVENEVTLQMGPVVAMHGRLDGDALAASGAISQPIPLPDSLAARATPADSLETISYAIDATFAADSTFTGSYVIRAPDLIALARGTGARRCEQIYELRGIPLLSVNERAAEAGERR